MVGRRADLLASIGIVAIIVGVAIAEPIRRRFAAHPSKAECEAMLDRYVEHLAAAEGLAKSDASLAARRALARSGAARHPEFARCPEALTLEESRCALRASNADEFERCLP